MYAEPRPWLPIRYKREDSHGYTLVLLEGTSSLKIRGRPEGSGNGIIYLGFALGLPGIWDRLLPWPKDAGLKQPRLPQAETRGALS